ncbi:VOC family protein [Peribacillus sp. SCS-37]|uniref:VOC family protein n=1 Tax=Paraperibacillus esterisolvens TaxID=3115296 RepID=UPI003905DC03
MRILIELDHIVHAVNSRTHAAQIFNMNGIGMQEGGRHPDWGTSNSISYFGSSYLELLSIDNRETARNSDNPLISQISSLNGDEGIFQMALRTDNIEGDAITFSKLGLTVAGPFSGQRMTGTGELLRWKMLFVSSAKSSFHLPFFIEWDLPEGKKLTGTSDGSINQTADIGRVLYAVHDIDSVIKDWKKWFNIRKIKSYTNSREWNAICTEVKLGSASITFLEPKGEGLIKQVLSDKGQGPFGIEFTENTGQGKIHDLAGGYYLF